SLMLAMLKSMQAQGADVLMVAPMRRLMTNPWNSFFILGITMYIGTTFFWGTPTVVLVGPVLIPIAKRAGLPAMGAAVAISLFHIMALSGDLVIQGATKLSANAAEVSSSEILPYTGLFAVTVGIVSIVIAFYMLRRDMKRGHLESPIQEGIPGE